MTEGWRLAGSRWLAGSAIVIGGCLGEAARRARSHACASGLRSWCVHSAYVLAAVCALALDLRAVRVRLPQVRPRRSLDERRRTAAGLRFVVPALADSRQVLRRKRARRRRGVRLQRRRPAGHLLHQRREDACTGEDGADLLESPVPQRRRHAVHRRHRVRRASRARVTRSGRRRPTSTTTATSICSSPARAPASSIAIAVTGGSRMSRSAAGIASGDFARRRRMVRLRQ